MLNEQLKEQMISWRREFHQYPEVGFLEIRTASKLAKILDDLGYDLAMGREVMSEEHAMGKPSAEATAKHLAWALENGAEEDYVEPFKEGFTGIVATWDTGRPGPVVGIRCDIDALPVTETQDADHLPNTENFPSLNPGSMHACGHDAHMTVQLALATQIVERSDELNGKIKLIFQPAEEGTRGAKSMTEAGVVDDVDYFVASHIGMGIPDKTFVASADNWLATTKMDVSFKGKASHAGGQPEEGRNALLAAATAVQNIYAIPRHSQGASRMNVGKLEGGEGRNIIPAHATMLVEARGENSEVNTYITESVKRVIKAAAEMHDCEYEIDIVGEGRSTKGSEDIAQIISTVAEESGRYENVELRNNDPLGSEDATFFIERVQERGGQGTYAIHGASLAAWHHNEKFDINEESMFPASETMFDVVKKLSGQ